MLSPTCQAGLLTLRDAAGRVVLADAYARVVLADGTWYTTHGGQVRQEGPTTVVEARPIARTVRPDGVVGLMWRIEGGAAGLTLTLAVSLAAGADAIAIARLDVLVAPTGVPLEVEVLQTGYQSWSHATPVAPLAHQRDAMPPIAAPPLPPAEGVQVPWMTLLRPLGLLAGFTTAHAWHATLHVRPPALQASCHLEGRALAAGETCESERLLLLAGLPDALALDAYAVAAAHEMVARSPALGASKPVGVPTGWCSWYCYFTGISEEALLRNLDVLVAERHRLPVGIVQLDDGYQTAIGDWLSLNVKFPSGMPALVDRIHAAGFQAGLWLAPFLVGADSVVFAEHPDWVLRDAHGAPIAAIFNWGVPCYALDLTHPGVLTHLREVFTVVTRDWDYDYLKLDFLYAGAMRGVPHDPTVSSVQAYRRGLALVREIVGDRFVLACGAPFLPSVGLVDGMRVSPDTAPDWDHVEPFGTAPALVNAIRSTLAHGWMHRRWWVNDPDCVIVRSTDTRLTEAEVRCWATVVALSGGLVLLSDDLPALTPERTAILPRLLPPLGQAARPLEPVVDGLPTRAALALDGAYLAASFNWRDQPAEAPFNPAEWPGGPACPYHLLDLWTGEAWGPCEGPQALPAIAPHGVRLLRVVPALDRPQLLGTTLTLDGRASERWAEHTLTITLDLPGEHAGELVVAVPPGWQAVDLEGPAGPLRIPLVVRDRAEPSLAFRRV